MCIGIGIGIVLARGRRAALRGGWLLWVWPIGESNLEVAEGKRCEGGSRGGAAGRGAGR